MAKYLSTEKECEMGPSGIWWGSFPHTPAHAPATRTPGRFAEVYHRLAKIVFSRKNLPVNALHRPLALRHARDRDHSDAAIGIAKDKPTSARADFESFCVDAPQPSFLGTTTGLQVTAEKGGGQAGIRY